jgi:hypothetical protein
MILDGSTIMKALSLPLALITLIVAACWLTLETSQQEVIFDQIFASPFGDSQ